MAVSPRTECSRSSSSSSMGMQCRNMQQQQQEPQEHRQAQRHPHQQQRQEQKRHQQQQEQQQHWHRPQSRLLLLQLLLVALLCCGTLPFSAQAINMNRRRGGLAGQRHKRQLTQHDFVMVMTSQEDRLPLVQATRPLRVGVRTFITLGSQPLAEQLQWSQDARDHSESYQFYPDRKSGSRRWESRYVATPFLAHQFYGDSYKWMLVGDDDTLWFPSGLKRLFLRWDPAVPYFVSDNVVDYLFQPKTFLDKATHQFMGGQSGVVDRFLRPSWLGTTCLPCHSVQAEARLQEKFRRTPLESHNWLGCPCVNTQACLYRRRMCAHQNISDKHFCSGKWDKAHGSLCTFSWAWGGTGMVMSHGLLKRLTWTETMQPTVEKHLSHPNFDPHAGDWMLAMSIYDIKEKDGQEYPGYGITIPPYSAVIKGEVLHQDLMVFGPVTGRSRSIIKDPAAWLQNASCDADCVWVMKHTVSHHASVHADFHDSVPQAAAGIKAIAASHKAALLSWETAPTV